MLDLLGSVLDVARRDVRIAAGATSRRKIVEVAGMAPAEVARRLDAASEG